ncbi:transposase [Roseateles violae]|uniref:Transposase n=1 Tax=Roseateles violae TaxID=3058042 RepID=A0ABT8DY26_9BURK|nr:transposase [Pelomonas sp. PFR6]MDN3922474.1 transposase [Pelomonas sp. PFR6]
MARPLRIEFPGAVYHVSSRRAAGAPAFADDDDRQVLLDLLAQAMQRFDAQVLAYCLLPDHYDLVLYTRQANLSRLMRHVNGVYTQYHNRRHGGSGALFQGRFRAVLVDREALLLDLCRYVELSPQRLGLVSGAQDWPWSSYRAHAGLEEAPPWLDVDGLHGYVLSRPATTAAEHRRAAERYARLVASEPELDLWAGRLRQQIFLGDAAFAEKMRAWAARASGNGARRAARPKAWADWLRESESREEALYRAHTEGGLSMTTLAGALDLSVSRVSRLIAGYERAQAEATA